MPGQILVALRRNERLEQIIPYIERVAQPGMRVVFLIPYPVEAWLWLRDHWVTTESRRGAMLAGKKIMERYCREVQAALADQKLFLAREVLHRKGVEIAADVYTGSLRKVIGDYTSKGDVHLIMMCAASGLAKMRFLRGMLSVFGLFKRPSLSPMLLLRPDQGV